MKRRGFTLIEVMISMAIFATGVAAFTGFYAAMNRMSESSRNLTQAMNDARLVLEGIRAAATGRGDLSLVTGTKWTDWALANGLMNPATGQTWLENEVIKVFYDTNLPLADPPLDPGPTPPGLPPLFLAVTVRVEWTEHGWARWADVSTLVTRR